MRFASIRRGDPEQLFTLVKNASNYVMSVGHGVFWYAAPAANGTGPDVDDMYQVTYGLVTATLQQPSNLFAGLIAERAINVGEFGWVQNWGPHPGALVSGGETANYHLTGVFTVTNRTLADLATVVLRPLNIWGNASGGNLSAGYLGAYPLASSLGVTTQADAAALRNCWPGGYCVPMDNASPTIASNSSGSVKVFVKCLG